MALPSYIPTAGDNFHRQFNTIARGLDSGYTTPAVGDLVVLATAAANTVKLISGTAGIYAIVESLNSGNGIVSVTELIPGCQIEFPYTGVVAVGDKVLFSSATHGTALDRTQVKTDNTNGTGFVVAVDAAAPHGTGHAVVRF